MWLLYLCIFVVRQKAEKFTVLCHLIPCRLNRGTEEKYSVHTFHESEKEKTKTVFTFLLDT
jgi:hypothetical protein